MSLSESATSRSPCAPRAHCCAARADGARRLMTAADAAGGTWTWPDVGLWPGRPDPSTALPGLRDPHRGAARARPAVRHPATSKIWRSGSLNAPTAPRCHLAALRLANGDRDHHGGVTELSIPAACTSSIGSVSMISVTAIPPYLPSSVIMTPAPSPNPSRPQRAT